MFRKKAELGRLDVLCGPVLCLLSQLRIYVTLQLLEVLLFVSRNTHKNTSYDICSFLGKNQ